MSIATITPTVTKPRNNLTPANLFISLVPPKIVVQNQPDEFVSALAHEVRNPLTNINLAVEILKSAISDNDQKYLDIIMRSSVRITDLINELLKNKQGDEGQGEKHSIHQLLDEVLDMAKDRLMLKHIVIRKEYAAQDCEIALNRPQMKIALTNIIINAIDAMASERGTLKMATKSMEGRCVLQIEDNGCGISKKNLKYIFTPYFTSKPGGLGLGLATTFDILRSNHVGVNVKSEEGEGTRFILLFEKKKYNLFHK